MNAQDASDNLPTPHEKLSWDLQCPRSDASRSHSTCEPSGWQPRFVLRFEPWHDLSTPPETQQQQQMLNLRNQDHSTHDQPSLTLHLLFNPFFRSFCSNTLQSSPTRGDAEVSHVSHCPDSTQDIHPRTTQGAGEGGGG